MLISMVGRFTQLVQCKKMADQFAELSKDESCNEFFSKVISSESREEAYRLAYNVGRKYLDPMLKVFITDRDNDRRLRKRGKGIKKIQSYLCQMIMWVLDTQPMIKILNKNVPETMGTLVKAQEETLKKLFPNPDEVTTGVVVYETILNHSSRHMVDRLLGPLPEVVGTVDSHKETVGLLTELMSYTPGDLEKSDDSDDDAGSSRSGSGSGSASADGNDRPNKKPRR